jgi:predicted nucleic acid-binding protein
MLPLRLVLDTNVVVSAALKPDGVQARFFSWRSRGRHACTFPWP